MLHRAVFSVRGYDNYTLGDATQQELQGDLEQSGLSGFPCQPSVRCAAGALPELRDAMEPLSLVIPTFHKAETIALVTGEIPAAALPS